MSEDKKCALVTAGAKRVGKVLALKLAASGFDIALHYRNSKEDAENTAGEIESLGKRCLLFQADLHDDRQLENLIPSVLEQFGQLSVLINNASVWQPGRYLDSSLADLKDYMRIHLEVPYILTRDFARLARNGMVVNMLDSNIVKHKSNHFAYILSKKALYDLTMLSASELAPAVRVNAIAPGAILTPDDHRKEKYEKQKAENPLQRSGSPDDVASALEFLLRSEHVSGQCIFVSGGKQLL